VLFSHAFTFVVERAPHFDAQVEEGPMMRRLWYCAVACVLLVCATMIAPHRAQADPAPTSSIRVMPGKAKAAADRSTFEIALKPGYGKVCRNGNLACPMSGSGWIGYSCCGCGFCGWWSAN
jgi:hypothetical protein